MKMFAIPKDFLRGKTAVTPYSRLSSHFSLRLLILSLVSLPGLAPCCAAELTVLHTFSADSPSRAKFKGSVKLDGARPLFALIQGRDGALYGTTIDGGNHEDGVVFKINPDGTGFAVLHSFDEFRYRWIGGGANKGGSLPGGSLVQGSDGTLYGAAERGGWSGNGLIFKLNPDGSGFQVLHQFGATKEGSGNRNNDGIEPAGLTLGPDGQIYGTALFAGRDGGGVLFKMHPDGTAFSVIHAFRGVTYDKNINEGGSLPEVTPTLGHDGTLYGTTNIGGKYGYGVLYRITADGTNFAVLHHFQRDGPGFEANGVFPQGPLTLAADGFLYGTTRQGGAEDAGVLFQVKSDGTGFTVLHTFSPMENSGADGWLPAATPVLGRDGRLYGLTNIGGANGTGTAFWASTDGRKFVVLHDFSLPDKLQHNPDGSFPRAGLVQGRDGSLYGVAASGGPNGTGTVFRLVPPHAK